MSMSKKHYEQLAITFGNALADTKDMDARKSVRGMIDDAVSIFRADNPRFCPVRFNGRVTEVEIKRLLKNK